MASKSDEFETFEDLKKLSAKQTAELEDKLYTIYRSLKTDQTAVYDKLFQKCWGVYSGNDTEFKEQLQAYFGDKDIIYDSMDLNSIIKSVLGKTVQPFLSKDQTITVVPNGELEIDLAERIESLLNKQLKEGNFLEEDYKVLKDGLIYGFGFMKVGWEVKRINLPKKTVKEYTNINPNNGEEESSYEEAYTTEEVIIENPDFACVHPSTLYFPRVKRWKDLPYLLHREVISSREFNIRYADKKDYMVELGAENRSSDNDITGIETILNMIPGTNSPVGNKAIDEVNILHFYFSNGQYIVALLSGTHMSTGFAANGVKVLKNDTSPIPGLPIPVIPFIPEPVSNRLIGESLALIGMNDLRKVTESDNLSLKITRNYANAPLFYTDSAGLDINLYKNRTPNMPIKVQDIGEIKEMDLRTPDATLLNQRAAYQSDLQSVTGQTDFAQGNIGRSARLTGVDSLIGLVMSRLSMAMQQYNDHILKIADALILANRFFLPKTFVQTKTALHISKPIEAHEIPYPVKMAIGTPLAGFSDKAVYLSTLKTILEFAIQSEAREPGSWDVPGLTAYFSQESGFKEVRRFMLKPLADKNTMNLLGQLDQAIRMNANPGNLTPEQIQAQQTQQPTGGMMGGLGQANMIAPITETQPPV